MPPKNPLIQHIENVTLLRMHVVVDGVADRSEQVVPKSLCPDRNK